MSYYCGIDLGGTNIKAGIVDGEGEITEQSTDQDIVMSADQAAGRLDAALYFYRLCGSEPQVECPFPDVPDEYAEAVAWLFSEGIVKGVGNGLYGFFSDCDNRRVNAFNLKALEDGRYFPWSRDFAAGFRRR